MLILVPPAGNQTSETLLLIPQTYFGSTELLLVLLNAYALSTATLHQCRIKDKYQNHVAGLCLLGAEAVSYGLLPGYTGQEESTGPLALLPLALLFGLLASALAHAAIGPRDEETEVGLKGDTWRNTEGDIEGTHEVETQAESASKA